MNTQCKIMIFKDLTTKKGWNFLSIKLVQAHQWPLRTSDVPQKYSVVFTGGTNKGTQDHFYSHFNFSPQIPVCVSRKINNTVSEQMYYISLNTILYLKNLKQWNLLQVDTRAKLTWGKKTSTTKNQKSTTHQ